jgi:hypothetical protein
MRKGGGVVGYFESKAYVVGVTFLYPLPEHEAKARIAEALLSSKELRQLGFEDVRVLEAKEFDSLVRKEVELKLGSVLF